MEWIIFIWLTSAVSAMFVFADWWRNSLDFKVEDVIGFGLISFMLGPIGLLIACLLWAFDWAGKRIPNKTIWKRK